MDWWLQFIIILAILFTTILLGMPVAFALGFTSLLAITLWWGEEGLYIFALTASSQLTNFLLIAIPLFIFMAELLVCSRLAEDAFTVAHKWLSWLPGGLAVSSIALATLSAAVIGTSTGGAAVVGGTAIPEMRKRGYDSGLACGSTAAGGALGILIPPSLFLIAYAILAEVSVGKLFMAGFIPGLLLALLFIIFIIIRCHRDPSLAPTLPGITWRDRFSSLWRILPLIFLIAFMLIAFYRGITSVSEVAGITSFAAMLIAIAYRRLTWQRLRDALMKSLRVTSMITWVLLGAFSFSYVLNRLGLTRELCEAITTAGLSSWSVILLVNIILMVLGCIMDPGAIIMFSVPIFIPVIESLGFDLIWFGIVVVMNLEMAEITPPFGFNLFVIKGVAPDVKMGDIIKGAAPFIPLQALALILVIVFPSIALWLPKMM